MKEVLEHPYFADIDFDKLLNKEYKAPYKPTVEVHTLRPSEFVKIEKAKLYKTPLPVPTSKKTTIGHTFTELGFHGIMTEERMDEELSLEKKLFID